MTDEPTPFMDYWEAVRAAMLKFFGVDTSDAGIDPALIASAQEECQAPEAFARWHGNKHDLTYLNDWKVLHGIPTAASQSKEPTKTKTAKLSEHELSQFTGSENWYRHGVNRNVVLTDSAKHVADEGGAYWLLDAIAICQRYEKRVTAAPFQVLKLTVRDDRRHRWFAKTATTTSSIPNTSSSPTSGPMRLRCGSRMA
jgi:hypothetical protein